MKQWPSQLPHGGWENEIINVSIRKTFYRMCLTMKEKVGNKHHFSLDNNVYFFLLSEK